MSVFKSYDIRGMYNKEWDKDTAYRIGYFLSTVIKTNKVLIGYDVRESTPEIFNSLADGITDSGTDVYSIGLSTTPMVYFATSFYSFDCSVMITASHNPKEYNGLKISRTNSVPVGYETGLQQLEEMVKTGIILKKKKGAVKKLHCIDDYVHFIKSYVLDKYTVNFVIDYSNGMASLFKDTLFNKEKKHIFDTPDGTFPNHSPNPLEEQNRRDIVDLTLKTKSDIGIIFDGDADRVMFIDEKGFFIQPDYIIALLGYYFKDRKPLSVLYDIRTSYSVSDYLKQLGATTYMWKVGHAYAKKKLREIDGIFGGELAGHYYFKDFYYCDSGILAALLILQATEQLKKQNISLSSFFSSIVRYHNSGECNYTIQHKKEAMDAIIKHTTALEKPKAYYDFDGYRVEFDQWWFNVRPSNTEPYLRIIIEADNKAILEEKKEFIESILHSFM